MKTKLDTRYFKPLSVSWWAGIAPAFAGAFLVTVPVHGLNDYAQVVRDLTGNVEPVVLINLGLAAIGLRGAVDAKD